MRRYRPSTLSFLATVPFLLLSGAQQVHYQTVIYPDGSGYRVMTAEVNPDQLGDISKRAAEAQPMSDRTIERKGTGTVTIERNFWAAGVDRLPDAALKIDMLLEEPLSLSDKYEWSETVKIYSDSTTDSQKAGASLAVLNYTVELPGTVAQDSVSPAGQAEGHNVTWKLTAAQPEYTLKATSYRPRYGLLAILLYLVICGAIFGGRFLRTAIANRPRKI